MTNKKRDIITLTLVICTIVLVSVVTLVFNYRVIFNVTSQQAEDLGALQMNDIRAQLQQTLDKAKQDTLAVASSVQMILNNDGTKEELELYLRQARENLADGSCINVYCASLDWYVIPDFDAPNNFHASTRKWYSGAASNKGKIYICQPYLDLASDYVCFTVSYRLQDSSVVVALDYNLTEIQKYITEMSEGGRTALIVSEDGTIVGYNESELLGQSIVDVLPEYVSVFNLEKNNANQVVIPQVIGGVNQTVFCSKTENNWYLILCVDTSELYRESHTQFGILCAINIALILAILALYLFSRRNRKKAEENLSLRDEFLAELSGDMRSPISTILNNSNPDFDINPKEGLERVRESAIRLSEMVGNLVSYSNIATKKKRKDVIEEQNNNINKVNKQLRNGVIAIILAAMIVSIFVFSITNIRLEKRQLVEEADRYEYELSQWIVEQKSKLSMFSSIISAEPNILDDYDYCIKLLDDVSKNYTDISVVYMTNPEREHTVYMNNGWEPDEDWHVEERQWYIDTLNSSDGFNISAPYFDEQTGIYCVTFSQCVYDNNDTFLGIFGIDFYMDKLTEILSNSYSEIGYAFLVDANGTIINHPYAYYQMTQKNSTNILDLNYCNAYANESTLLNITDYDNVKRICTAEKNDDSNFTVIVVKNWWNTYASIILIDCLFLFLFLVSLWAVAYIINRSLKWQDHVTIQLQEAADTATAAGKAKTQFLAQMSHEIRTPINAVLGMNEMILRESTQNEVREYALDIQSAGRTLLSLINSILDFSKIEDGKMEIVNIEYDTSSTINDLVNMISERAEKKGLELKLEIDENLPMTMYGDDLRIRQVITNLLTNAVKYTEKGSITMKISGNRISDNKIDLHVSVRDTGIGIKEEDMDRLCNSFQRLDQERNHNIEGTGLGLSIVSKLLQMMGSELKVESIYGDGSNFYFNIEQKIISDTPIGDFAKRQKDAVASLESKAYLYAPEAKVLVVDDNEMNLKVAGNLMKRNGFIPDVATSGLQCISAVESKEYDIIFLDHMMPGMDGIETLHRLKDGNLLKENTVVIALTANAISGAKEMYLDEGFSDYLSKPIDVERLEKKLARYLPEEKVHYKNDTNENENIVQETVIADAKSNENVNEEEAEQVKKYINYELGLSYSAGDDEIYRDVLQAYLDEADEKIEKLDTYYEAKDWNNYAIIAHAMKSTSLTIGAEELSALAKEHEFAGKEGRADDIDATYFKLLELYQYVLAEVKEYLDGNNSEE